MALSIALSLAIVVLATGCTQVNEWLRGEQGSDTEALDVEGDASAAYLKEMSELASGDPAMQAEIYADAAAAARVTPNTSSRLRFALVLATPGHPGSDPELAQNILRELLSETALLTPVERSLATIHLREVEERLTLDAETRRLRLASARAASSEEDAVAQRIAAVESENRQLRQSLAEAEEKLEAITSIERSIREQTDNTTQQ
ncbi:MAG TPA: hypothetical protein VNQ14_01135 [Woeseiaceae bacterium]|nr:hypothetical protein [Woeseiaceae bacterium]